MFLYITTNQGLKPNGSGKHIDGADRFASASQIGAIGAADVPPACWPCSLRSRRAIMRMEPTFTQKLRFFVSGGSSAAPLGNLLRNNDKDRLTMTNAKKSEISLSINILESITYITRAIALGDLGGKEAFEEILQLAAKFTGADFGSIHIYDSKDKNLKVVAILGDIPASQFENLAIDVGIGVTGWVAKNKKPVVISDIPKIDDQYIKFFTETSSELAVPILSEGELVGVLNLESSKKNNFSADSIKIIDILTSLLDTVLKKEEIDRTKKELVSTKHIDTNKDLVFVLMPFREPFNKYYRTIIRPAIEEANLSSLRVDEIFGPTNISEDIWNSINRAKVVLAELTARNPNVMYELGLSHGIGKPVIMMSQSIDDVPFDLRHLRCILYDTIEPEWASLLKSNITDSIKSVLSGNGDNSPFYKKTNKETVA